MRLQRLQLYRVVCCQVFRSGKQADYSSEEEEEAKEAAAASNLDLPRGLLEFEGSLFVWVDVVKLFH